MLFLKSHPGYKKEQPRTKQGLDKQIKMGVCI